MKKLDNGKIVVNSSYTAGWLIKHGAIVIDIAPNKHIENATVFYFMDTPQLEKIIDAYWDYMRTNYGATGSMMD